MNNTKLDLCRNRDFGGLFSVTIDFIKQNFKQYLKTILIYVFPFMLLAGFAVGFIFQSVNLFDIESTLQSNPGEVPEINWFSFGAACAGSALFYGIALVMMCAISFRYVQLYIKQDAVNHLSPKEIWNESKDNLGWLIGYSLIFFLFFISSYFGIIALCAFIAEMISPWLLVVIIPLLLILFFYVIIVSIYIIPLKMEEPELSFFEVFSKCFKLVKGNWWKSFGFIFVFNMLLGIVSYVFIIPMYIAIFGMALFQNNSIALFLTGLTTGVSYGLAILVSSFIYIAIAIIFYSLYDKLTGNSLKNQIDSIGSGLGYNSVESI